MSLRKRLRALIAAPGLTVLPGAYDALSARIIAREGFDAVMAGGYAANGSLLAQGPISDIEANPRVREVYLGDEEG